MLSFGQRGEEAEANMEIPFKQITDTVRGSTAAEISFNLLRQVGRKALPSDLWDQVPTPDVEADVERARIWLRRNISKDRPTGVYLGLDTLNGRGLRGHNVEIGMSRSANPRILNMAWTFRCDRYGNRHLIRGLRQVHRTYERRRLGFDTSNLADYVFFLGYSGIVLTAAIERLAVSWEALFVWGFHDGDIGYLARTSEHGIERLASFGAS